MTDERWEMDTLFLVFEEDFRFRENEERTPPVRLQRSANPFAEPSAAKGCGNRPRQVSSTCFRGGGPTRLSPQDALESFG